MNNEPQMNTFKEFPVGTFIMRFYKTDHVWTCTVTENMLDEVIKIANPLSEEYIEAEWSRLRKAQDVT
jgi:hypothetical protein